MKKNRIARIAATMAAAALCVFAMLALAGCGTKDDGSKGLTSETGLTGGVAATVNGVEIKEDEITRYINDLRLSYNLDEESEWKDYLENSKMTPEAIRYTILGTYIANELLKQCAGELDISVTDEEVDERVQKMADKYPNQQAWEKAVKDAGYHEGIEGYREQVKESLLQQRVSDLYEQQAKDELTNRKLLDAINESLSQYDGAKRTSQIVFSTDDADLAKKVRQQIESGEISFKDAVEKYSTDESSKAKDGDMGWDKLGSLPEDYTNAIEKLKKGALSKVVTSDDAIRIIQVTDVYNAPKKAYRIGSVPEDFVTEIKETTLTTNAKTKYNDWMDEVRSQQDIVVNPMPENVPYNVDLSGGEMTQEEMDKATQDAYNELVGNTEEEAEEVSGAEAEAAEGNDEAASEDEAAAEDTAEASDEAADEESEDAEEAEDSGKESK